MGFFREIKRDIEVIFERDPAAANLAEVVLTYPGLHAREIHRLSHTLWNWRLPVIPRLISHVGRFVTGVEIHPGAKIGSGFFIDHGSGVVIGETSEIRDDVSVFQGVTLGGTSTRRTKRHPTLENNVVVGAGAKVIGAVVIGENVKIGAGSVVVTSVPANATVVGVPGRVVALRNPDDDTLERLPDPEWDFMQSLLRRLEDLEARLTALEAHVHADNGAPTMDRTEMAANRSSEERQ